MSGELSVIVVGIDHHQASLDLLEKVTVGEAELATVLISLREASNVEESVLVSTCLRTEVYAVATRFHDAVSEIQEILAEKSGLSLSEIDFHSTVRFDDDVPLHLFRVTAGLESAILGEGEVLGQVRRSFELARTQQTCGPVLSDLFRHALVAGKRARTETNISRGTTSFAHAAVQLAERHLRDLGESIVGQQVLIVGAGEMGAGVLRALYDRANDAWPADVIVANRSTKRAQALCENAPQGFRARTVELSELNSVLVRSRVVLVCVETQDYVVKESDLVGTTGGSSTPVLIVDLAMPRSVDPHVGTLDGITLLDMDNLTDLVSQALIGREEEALGAQVIVAQEVERLRNHNRQRGAAPVISALRSKLESLRLAEMERNRAKLSDLSESEYDQVDMITRATLAKLLHEPTLALKKTAGTAKGERLIEALRALFDL